MSIVHPDFQTTTPTDRYGDGVDLRTVIPGAAAGSHPITYSADVWDLEGMRRMGVKDPQLNFANMPFRWRPTAKDATLLMLAPKLVDQWAPGHHLAASHRTTDTAPRTAQTYLRSWSSLLCLMDQVGLTTLDDRDWDLLAGQMRTRVRTSVTGRSLKPYTPRGAAEAADRLARLHDLTVLIGAEAPFGTRPFGRRNTYEVFTVDFVKRGERRNAKRPTTEVFAMLGAALNLLDLCADELLDRLAWWTSRPSLHQPEHYGSYLDPQSCNALVDIWTAGTGQPIPTVEFQWGDRLLTRLDTPLMAAYAGSPEPWSTGAVPRYTNHSLIGKHETADALEIVDPYEAATGTPRPGWLPDDEHLLPTHVDQGGLYRWTNALVFATYYAVAAITALRELELNALTPDCLEPGVNNGPAHLRGLKIKQQDITDPPPLRFAVSDDVARCIDIVNRLRDTVGLENQTHPRLPGRSVLMSANLVIRGGKGRGSRAQANTLLFEPLSAKEQRRQLIPVLEALASTGHGTTLGYASIHHTDPVPADALPLHPHGVINMSALDVYVDRRDGEFAAIAVRQWRSLTTVPLGYHGHRPQVVFPADAERVAEHRRERGELIELVQAAVADEDGLTGPGRKKVRAMIEADTTITTSSTIKQLARRLAPGGTLQTLSIGWLSGCAGAEGGLCTDSAHVNHRLCVLGCRNGVLLPHQRARIELERRSLIAMLGPHHHLTTKTDTQADLLTAERRMTDDQLLDVLFDGYDERFQRIARPFYDPNTSEAIT